MKKLLFFAAILLLGACSEDIMDSSGLDIDSKSYLGKSRSHKVTEQDAVNILMAHFASLNREAVSRGSEPDSIPGVKDITVIRGSDLGISQDSTKYNDFKEDYSEIDENADSYLYDDPETVYLDTLFYVVNFENNGGFAILPADDRTDPIYAIIDEGNFHVDSLNNEQNAGFLGFLDESVITLMEDVGGPQNSPGNRRYWQTFPGEIIIDGYGNGNIKYGRKKIEPMLKAKWDQSEPYNYECPGPYTGCVITATAQIMSYFQTFDKFVYVKHGDRRHVTLDWAQIMSDCSSDGRFYGTKPTTTSARQLAYFMAYLGHVFGAEYDSEGTSANSAKAIEWMDTYGNLKATKLSDFNANMVAKALEAGNLVYARGSSKKNKFLGFITTGFSGGHAWVCDGAIIDYADGYMQRLYVHCNWGWGGDRNGYFLSKAFKTMEPLEYDDGSDKGNESNFKYKNECSIISRR